MSASIVILDGSDVPSPEDLAMVQAMYSRSPKSVRVHLEKVREVGSGKFMEQFYCGYGHQSIGDCGFITICVEDCSLLAAKAIQDTPLYNGQEASTRYLDMTARPLVNPIGTSEGREILNAWMKLYAEATEALPETLRKTYPRQENEKEAVYEKAIRARAFDIARALLPAGVTTFVAWTTNLRQAHDHLKELRNHLLEEVRDIATDIDAALLARYPSSFKHTRHEDEEAYVSASMARFGAYDAAHEFYYPYANGLRFHADFLGLRGIPDVDSELLAIRPPRAELHQRFRRYGQIVFRFGLDFGSYRDLQRHRSSVQEMPLLSWRHGLHPWYDAWLPREATKKIPALVRDTQEVCEGVSEDVDQYYVPIGYVVPVVMACSLPSAVYIAELRSGPTVHPTLRTIAQQMGDSLEKNIPGIVMHHDRTEGGWTIKRGAQDIEEKK